MARDNSNIPHSCPFLDKIKDSIGTAENYIGSDNVAIEYLADCYPAIEKAREIHDDLRSWGNGLFDELKEANDNAEYYFEFPEDKNMSLARFCEQIFFARRRNFGKSWITRK
jgi:hypothetical protein